MRFFYSLALYLAIPFIFLRLLWRARRAPAYAKRWSERFGFFNYSQIPGGIWLHAVSVGEVIAATPLIHALKLRYPDFPITVTTTTPTGSERVRMTFGTQVYHVYAPYDFPHAINRFLNQIKPRMALIIETELWPNLLAHCKTKQIPVFLVNARLSEKSAVRYARFQKITRNMLRNISFIAAQATADAKRFLDLGFDQENLHVTGNIKYDLNIFPELIDAGKQTRRQWGEERPVWIAASTHAGEDEMILSSYAQLKKIIPTLVLILVPRHPERFQFVANACEKQGFKINLRSQNKIETDLDILIGDTMGELLLLYAAADTAFVGGSLIPKGGHNLIEPAALGLPVISGKHLFNFDEIREHLQSAKALFIIENQDELTQQVLFFLQNSEERLHTGSNALAVVNKHKGALEKQMGLIQKMMMTL